MVGIGLVGYGYWGPNLLRNFVETPDATVIAVCDLNQDCLDLVQARYPSIKTTKNTQELFDDPDIDAIIIATPVSTHFKLAIQALDAGKHVFVEKPLTTTFAEGEELVEKAKQQGRTVMVDHTFLYTGAVQKIKEQIDSGEMGDIYYYDSVRVNLGLFQHDVNVIWDLAVHDLAIMDHLLPTHPLSVSATGMSHVADQPENIAYLTLFFEKSLMAHIHVNWLAPVKIRRTLISGSRKMIVYDDLEPSEKVKIYDKGIELTDSKESIYKMLIGYRTGDLWVP
ncbi:MAG: Gfo/Idh/MocA family oxidoreductase, partial [Planctomycetota bacterium]|nr:Gfo/Idh/MocA family oxidoreductase [Planctomycetota bacterium]